MMCVPPHAIIQLSNRQSLPPTDNSDLQREVVRVIKTEGLAKRLNHHEFDVEQSKMQINTEVEGWICCKSRCNAHWPSRENTGEPYYSPQGKCLNRNAQKHNSKMVKTLDRLPMSLGQTQHKQI